MRGLRKPVPALAGIDDKDAAAGTGQLGRRRQAGVTATDNNDVETGFMRVHDVPFLWGGRRSGG